MNSTKKTRNSIIKSTWYRFLLITLTVVLVSAVLVELIQAVELLKRIDKTGVAEQLAQVLNLSRNITNGSSLVTSLRVSAIIAITSSSIILFLVTVHLFIQAEKAATKGGNTSSSSVRQSFKTALYAVIASLVALAVSITAFVLYEIRLRLFEETEGVCGVLYGYENCDSTLFNIRKFALVPILILGFIYPLSLINLYLVWKHEKHYKAKKAKREARIEEERLYSLPVVDYGSGNAANDTSANQARTGVEIQRS